jgi:putrescine transport system permease protein
MNYRRSFFILTCLAFGFAFLYVPILSMVVFSFNASKLVTVWDSANSPTLKWYYSLLHNDEILDAAWISLKVAVMNASGSVILGTLAGFGLARFSQFRGRFTLNAMTTAPLVMPEVITGLSLLLLFVALEQTIGWPAGRGITTMTIGHMTFSMAYVTVAHGDLRYGARGGRHGSGRPAGEGFLLDHAAHHFPGHSVGLAAGVHAVLG